MLKRKNLIIITASSFFFLFLISILAGNTLFSAILKAFFSSLLFSCIIIIAGIILKKLIPELVSLDSTVIQDGMGGIDVVLDQENPYTSATGNNLVEEVIASGDKDEDDFSKKEFIEEVEEESIGDISALAPDVGDDVIELMTEDGADGGFPSIDTSGTLGNSTGSFLGNNNNDALAALGIDTDANTMAKYIRTVIKKDEK